MLASVTHAADGALLLLWSCLVVRTPQRCPALQTGYLSTDTSCCCRESIPRHIPVKDSKQAAVGCQTRCCYSTAIILLLCEQQARRKYDSAQYQQRRKVSCQGQNPPTPIRSHNATGTRWSKLCAVRLSAVCVHVPAHSKRQQYCQHAPPSPPVRNTVLPPVHAPHLLPRQCCCPASPTGLY